jgi:serine/threonine protein kinase
MRWRFMKHLSRAIVKHGIRFVMNQVPFGGVIFDFTEMCSNILVETWEGVGNGSSDCLPAEVKEMAQATPERTRSEVEQAVREEAADQPPEVQQAIRDYLSQVPATIYRSLRSGELIPNGMRFCRAEDLQVLLPKRPPRFKPGIHPLPGVDWELVQLLGVGGFGEVWKARNPNMPNRPPVALKFCLDKMAAKVLRNEAAVLDRVMREGKHPGIVELLHTYLNADPPCLEYEYVDGGELTALIREWHQGYGGPSPTQASKVILGLAETIAFAHQQNPPIVHRDLKPANILFRRKGNGYEFKITDFGIGSVATAQAAREATRGTEKDRSQASAVAEAYTKLYASPEQIAGKNCDPRDDIYSLAVIWYQLVTGNLGAEALTGSGWLTELKERGMPKPLIRLLRSCLDERARRPADAVAFAKELRQALTDDSPRERPSQPPHSANDRDQSFHFAEPTEVLQAIIQDFAPEDRDRILGSASTESAQAPTTNRKRSDEREQTSRPRPAGNTKRTARRHRARQTATEKDDGWDRKAVDLSDAGSCRPHRGQLISGLGFASFLFPFPLGPIVWLLGNLDLQEMKAGRMDPKGEAATRTGRLCGKVATIGFGILFAFSLVFSVLFLLITGFVIKGAVK